MNFWDLLAGSFHRIMIWNRCISTVFLKIACIDGGLVEPIVAKLDKISEAFSVNFVISISLDEEEFPASLKDKIIVSL